MMNRAPRWCDNGNACIYSNCPHRHERCAHFDAGRCRHKTMAKPCDGGCMYDHRDASTLVEFVRNVRLYDYNDIMDVFEERGLVELIDTGDELFSTAKMSTADRKLLVRSLKDGGFMFNVIEHSDEDGEVYDRIIEIREIPGVGPFSPVYGPEPKPMELTEEDLRMGAMSAAEYNEYTVKRWGAAAEGIRVGLSTADERRQYVALLSGVPINRPFDKEILGH